MSAHTTHVMVKKEDHERLVRIADAAKVFIDATPLDLCEAIVELETLRKAVEG